MYDVISKRNFNRLEALKQEKKHKFDIYMENLKQIIDGDKDCNEYLQYIEVFLKQKCRRRDSNPQGITHMNLNHARLPIPPLRQIYY